MLEVTIAVEACYVGCRHEEVWELVAARLVLAEDRCAAGVVEFVAGLRSLLLVASRDFSTATQIVCIAYYLVG